MTNKNFYKMHRILMPNGSVYALREANDAESTPARGVTNNSSLAKPINSASSDSIPQNGEDGNIKLSLAGSPYFGKSLSEDSEVYICDFFEEKLRLFSHPV